MGDGGGKINLSDTSFSDSNKRSAFFDTPISFQGLESLGADWTCPLSLRGFKEPTLSRNSPLNEGDGISIVSTSAIELAGLPHRQITKNFQNFVLKSLQNLQYRHSGHSKSSRRGTRVVK
jgi:hypothetical protein